MKYSSRLSKYQYERLSAICDDLIHCNLSSKAFKFPAKKKYRIPSKKRSKPIPKSRSFNIN